jgi:hypothetical protein
MGGWAIGILFWKKHGQNIYLWLFLKFNTNAVNNSSFFGFWNANFLLFSHRISFTSHRGLEKSYTVFASLEDCFSL